MRARRTAPIVKKERAKRRATEKDLRDGLLTLATPPDEKQDNAGTFHFGFSTQTTHAMPYQRQWGEIPR